MEKKNLNFFFYLHTCTIVVLLSFPKVGMYFALRYLLMNIPGHTYLLLKLELFYYHSPMSVCTMPLPLPIHDIHGNSKQYVYFLLFIMISKLWYHTFTYENISEVLMQCVLLDCSIMLACGLP